jgi:hypothetical protein
MFFRFIFGGITLALPRLAVGYAHVRDLAAVTAPALRNLWNAAMSDRFFARRVALTTSSLANFERGFNDLPVDAAPTFFGRSTMPDRFFA